MKDILETKRLILREYNLEDKNDLYEYLSDERVTKFMPYNTYQNIEDVEKWIKEKINENKEHNFSFAIFEKNQKKVIGGCSIRFKKELQEWSFGYNINYNFWNKGYATEATKAMINFIYQNYNGKIFTATAANGNKGSAMVMEKNGLTFEEDVVYFSYDGKRKYEAKKYKLIKRKE